MKSTMPFYGVTAPIQKVQFRAAFAAHAANPSHARAAARPSSAVENMPFAAVVVAQDSGYLGRIGILRKD